MTRDEILAEYRRQAALGQFQGLTVLQYEAHLRKLCARHRPKTLLDHGSGHGKAWSGGLRLRLGIESVTRYDPAIPAIADKPEGRFDAVVSCDVLEHIPREDVNGLVRELFHYAEKFVFATVCCRPAKKCFPDGTNMHITIEPLRWWRERFKTLATCEWHLLETP